MIELFPPVFFGDEDLKPKCEAQVNEFQSVKFNLLSHNGEGGLDFGSSKFVTMP